MKNIIVSGANGFIGKNICKTLIKRGYNVTVLLRHECKELLDMGCMVYTSIPEKIPEQVYDVFYHLAWAGAGGAARSDTDIQLSNVKSTLEYYRFAEKIKCKKFIAIGTIAQKTLEVNNAKFLSNTFVYAATKNYTKTLLEIISRNSSCQFIWATLCGIYGVGDSTNNIINYALKGILHNQSVEFGPANNLFDFVYIDDVIEALILLGESELREQSYQIGSGEPRLLSEYLSIIGRCLEKEELIQIGVRPDDGIRYPKEWFDISPLIRDTGYENKISFDEGILKTIKWIRDNEGENCE